MITPNEFVKTWNLLHKNLMKVVSDDNVPDILFTLDYVVINKRVSFIGWLSLKTIKMKQINKIMNNDKEFQESLAQPVAMKAEKNKDKITIKKV